MQTYGQAANFDNHAGALRCRHHASAFYAPGRLLTLIRVDRVGNGRMPSSSLA